jgi:hypothetical protein
MELVTGRRRIAIACVLVVLGVSGSSAQTVAAPGSTPSAEFYLRRGEDSSSAREYDRAIADYSTAIGLKPDFGGAIVIVAAGIAILRRARIRNAGRSA